MVYYALGVYEAFQMHVHNLSPKRQGLTLIEVVIALVIVAVGLMGIMSALLSVSTLVNSNHDQLVAINIARQKLAEIQNATFQTTFAQYGPNSETGGNFTISQLENGSGKIIFPVNSSGKLDETVINENLGMPQDLNGNGNKIDTDVSATYTILPIRIHLQWTSSTGARELDLNTMLTK